MNYKTFGAKTAWHKTVYAEADGTKTGAKTANAKSI